MVINIIFTSFFGFISAFSPEWISFMITRGLTGLGVVGGHVPFSLFSEFLPTRFRGVFLIFINAFWCVGGASSAGLAWAILPAETIASIRAWRWYLGISSIPYMLLILIVWLAPESPRYLYVSKRYEETEQVLQKVVRWNGKAPLEGRLATDEVDEKPQTRANFFLLFSKQFIRTTIPLFGVWFLMAFAYYGVIVMTPDYFKAHASSQDEPYIATFITSAAELPGTFVAAALINRIGRKYTQITMLAVCGVFMLLLMIPTYLWLLTIFAIVCRISVSGAFGTTFVFTPETYVFMVLLTC
jgi:MFS family permease